jgi:hypothetical protein
MATKKRRSDEGGSGAENKGRIPTLPEESLRSEGPYGDTEIDRDLEELEREGLMAGDGDRRREQIASNPDNEETLAEEALEAAEDNEDNEDEAGHDRRRH